MFRYLKRYSYTQQDAFPEDLIYIATARICWFLSLCILLVLDLDSSYAFIISVIAISHEGAVGSRMEHFPNVNPSDFCMDLIVK
jgi:hypothetical protein